MFVFLFNPQFDKDEENVNSWVINTGACVSLSARKTWNNCVPLPGLLLQGDWKEAIFYKSSNLGTLFTQPTAAGKRINDMQPGM